MSKIKWDWNDDGFWALRNSDAVKADLEARADRVAAAASAGYEAEGHERNPGFVTQESRDGANRARDGVTTGNPHAANYAAKHNILVRALEAGRG